MRDDASLAVAPVGLTIVLIVTFSLSASSDSFSEDPFFLSVAIVMILGYTTLGALIASRTERNPIGWLLMMIGAGFLLGGFTDEYLRYAIPRGMDGFFLDLSAWLTNWVFALVAFPIPGSSCSSRMGGCRVHTGGLLRSRSSPWRRSSCSD